MNFFVCSRAGFKSSFRVAAAYCFLKMQNAPRQTTLETEKLLFYHWFTVSGIQILLRKSVILIDKHEGMVVCLE